MQFDPVPTAWNVESSPLRVRKGRSHPLSIVRALFSKISKTVFFFAIGLMVSIRGYSLPRSGWWGIADVSPEFLFSGQNLSSNRAREAMSQLGAYWDCLDPAPAALQASCLQRDPTPSINLGALFPQRGILLAQKIIAQASEELPSGSNPQGLIDCFHRGESAQIEEWLRNTTSSGSPRQYPVRPVLTCLREQYGNGLSIDGYIADYNQLLNAAMNLHRYCFDFAPLGREHEPACQSLSNAVHNGSVPQARAHQVTSSLLWHFGVLALAWRNIPTIEALRASSGPSSSTENSQTQITNTPNVPSSNSRRAQPATSYRPLIRSERLNFPADLVSCRNRFSERNLINADRTQARVFSIDELSERLSSPVTNFGSGMQLFVPEISVLSNRGFDASDYFELSRMDAIGELLMNHRLAYGNLRATPSGCERFQSAFDRFAQEPSLNSTPILIEKLSSSPQSRSREDEQELRRYLTTVIAQSRAAMGIITTIQGLKQSIQRDINEFREAQASDHSRNQTRRTWTFQSDEFKDRVEEIKKNDQLLSIIYRQHPYLWRGRNRLDSEQVTYFLIGSDLIHSLSIAKLGTAVGSVDDFERVRQQVTLALRAVQPHFIRTLSRYCSAVGNESLTWRTMIEYRVGRDRTLGVFPVFEPFVQCAESRVQTMARVEQVAQLGMAAGMMSLAVFPPVSAGVFSVLSMGVTNFAAYANYVQANANRYWMRECHSVIGARDCGEVNFLRAQNNYNAAMANLLEMGSLAIAADLPTLYASLRSIRAFLTSAERLRVAAEMQTFRASGQQGWERFRNWYADFMSDWEASRIRGADIRAETIRRSQIALEVARGRIRSSANCVLGTCTWVDQLLTRMRSVWSLRTVAGRNAAQLEAELRHLFSTAPNVTTEAEVVRQEVLLSRAGVSSDAMIALREAGLISRTRQGAHSIDVGIKLVNSGGQVTLQHLRALRQSPEARLHYVIDSHGQFHVVADELMATLTTANAPRQRALEEALVDHQGAYFIRMPDTEVRDAVSFGDIYFEATTNRLSVAARWTDRGALEHAEAVAASAVESVANGPQRSVLGRAWDRFRGAFRPRGAGLPTSSQVFRCSDRLAGQLNGTSFFRDRFGAEMGTTVVGMIVTDVFSSGPRRSETQRGRLLMASDLVGNAVQSSLRGLFVDPMFLATNTSGPARFSALGRFSVFVNSYNAIIQDYFMSQIPQEPGESITPEQLEIRSLMERDRTVDTMVFNRAHSLMRRPLNYVIDNAFVNRIPEIVQASCLRNAGSAIQVLVTPFTLRIYERTGSSLLYYSLRKGILHQ